MIWKPAPMTDGIYEASSLGGVRRCDSGRVVPQSNLNGYRKVNLSISGSQRSRTVHAIVADAFLGARPSGMHINHIDGNKSNNRVENLEYVTPAENAKHARRIGLCTKRAGESSSRAKLTELQVKEIRSLLAKGTPGSDIASRFGVSRAAVWKIRRGYTWANE